MKAKWYEIQGPEGDVVASTRVRLARNLADFPFPGNIDDKRSGEIISVCSDALTKSEAGKDFTFIDIANASGVERRSLVERHLISTDHAEGKGPRAVFLSSDESISIMINEEDHIRLQVMGAGLCLEETLKAATEIDNILDSSVRYAFDENLGYLTKCPTNLGTGMRASVMLHLPALTESGAIRSLAANAGKLGFAVRGMYGEGSAAKGALYQVSNQMSLGFTEQTVIGRLSDALAQIIEQERKIRSDSLERDRAAVEDRVWRSAGLLKYARSISADEAVSLLSDVRMGVSLNLIDLPYDRLGSLIWEIQPANIAKLSGKESLTAADRDIFRAEYLRKNINIRESNSNLT
jgi:protein arginine kinase